MIVKMIPGIMAMERKVTTNRKKIARCGSGTWVILKGKGYEGEVPCKKNESRLEPSMCRSRFHASGIWYENTSDIYIWQEVDGTFKNPLENEREEREEGDG
jgi:hypothetical protein